MVKQNEKLGVGFIEKACAAVGVSRGAYYNALSNLKNNKPLTPDQIAVMKKYKEITEEARKDLKFIKEE